MGLDRIKELPAAVGCDEGVQRGRLLRLLLSADPQGMGLHDMVAQELGEDNHSGGIGNDDAVLDRKLPSSGREDAAR
jgi:hypothetical protein